MASHDNNASNTSSASDQGSPGVVHALMSPTMRAAVEDFTAKLMAEKLVEAGTDLSDVAAVREALRAGRFGEQLIENCAADAVERARSDHAGAVEATPSAGRISH